MAPSFCRVHGGLVDHRCSDCRVYSAQVRAFGFPEEPIYEEYEAGVSDCLNWIESGRTPAQIRTQLAEERAAWKRQLEAA